MSPIIRDTGIFSDTAGNSIRTVPESVSDLIRSARDCTHTITDCISNRIGHIADPIKTSSYFHGWRTLLGSLDELSDDRFYLGGTLCVTH